MSDMTGKDFENLSQRSLNYFLATFPSFTAVDSPQVSRNEQAEARSFIKGVYSRLWDNPELLGFSRLPDDSLGDREPQKEKPELVKSIRKTIKKTEDFIGLIYEIALKGEAGGNTLTVDRTGLTITPSGIRQLAAFGVQVGEPDNACEISFPVTTGGLKLLAEGSASNERPQKRSLKKPYLLFSRGVFNTDTPWTREVFGNMLGDRGPFDRLMDFLEEHEYTRTDNKEYDNKISLDYTKSYGDPGEELKAAWAERTRSGVEVTYEELRKNQFTLSLRMPYFREILQNAGMMDERVKQFVITTGRKCDGCRYCVQTDKSGKRPLARITVDDYQLCPLFPGFYYRWRTLDDTTTDDIIETLDFIDTIFADRKS